jgi:hypothetical protein
MNAPPPLIRGVSLAIIEAELAGREDTDAVADAAEKAFTKLRDSLSPLVGEAGFGAVMERALHVTAQEHGMAVSVHPATRVIARTDLVAAAPRDGAPRLKRWAVAVLAHVLALFCSFIGENLTLRLVRRVWRDLPRGPTASQGEEA